LRSRYERCCDSAVGIVAIKQLKRSYLFFLRRISQGRPAASRRKPFNVPKFA
jgi:hypothetical protein